MILPEHGYTPDNYKALVSSTKLTSKGFYEQFDIPKPTFYQHLRGDRTMKWQDWQSLLNQVNRYLDKTSQ